jgi:UDP-N-acetylmuramate-alanine ligase
MMDKKDVTEHLMKMKKGGDMILVLGAGDIKEVANELSDRLNKRPA